MFCNVLSMQFNNHCVTVSTSPSQCTGTYAVFLMDVVLDRFGGLFIGLAARVVILRPVCMAKLVVVDL